MPGLLILLLLVSVNAARSAAADYAEAGAMQRNGAWEIGVLFDPGVSAVSASAVGNYSINDPGVQITGLRYEPLNNGAVLEVTGLQTNQSYTLSLTNIQTTAGAALPSASISFTASPFSWTSIGSQELGFTADAIAVGTNGFDLISGGIQMRDIYDESTYAFQMVQGNFDKSIRVVLQEASSPTAKAGLMVREALDAGRLRPNDPFDPNQAFSRYLSVQVNPATNAIPDETGATNNQYEISIRSFTGGIGDPNFDITVNPPITNNAAPAYPNAWLRLKRVGQTFYVFRGEDGTNWISLGSFSFPGQDMDGNPVPAFSNSAFVGPFYSPENGNLPESSGARRAFLARFRDFGNASGDVPVDPNDYTLTIVPVGNQVEINWGGPGMLQSTTNIVSGPWTDLGATFPARLAPAQANQFFRVKLQ